MQTQRITLEDSLDNDVMVTSHRVFDVKGNHYEYNNANYKHKNVSTDRETKTTMIA
jgi:hypothetical protein